MMKSASDPNDSAITERGLGDYLATLASASPAPGGGSAVAVAGALAASLAEMVCNLTIGRAADSTVEAQLSEARDVAAELRSRLLDQAEDDEVAYGTYAVAALLPRATEAEQAVRQTAMQTALRGAADVPLSVAQACLSLLTALDPITRHGNKHVLSDALIAAMLAETALHGATLNVRVNARLMKDPGEAARYLSRADRLDEAGRRAATSLRDAAQPRS